MWIEYFPYAVAVWIFVAGLYGIITSRNLIHLVICLSVVQSATYIFLLAAGYRTGAAAPIFAAHSPAAPTVDPIVQALALTDIVVGATVTALLLAITVQIRRKRGSIDPTRLHPMRD